MAPDRRISILERFDAWTVVPLIFATLVLHLILIQPNHPGAMTWRALFVFPLELPAIILGLVALGQTRASRIIRAVLTVCLTLIATLKVADLISFNALSRGFNPVADLPLIESLIRLLIGALGPALAVLAVVAAIAAICAIAGLLWWAMSVWSRVWVSIPVAGTLGAAAVLFAAVAVAEIGM